MSVAQCIEASNMWAAGMQRMVQEGQAFMAVRARLVDVELQERTCRLQLMVNEAHRKTTIAMAFSHRAAQLAMNHRPREQHHQNNNREQQHHHHHYNHQREASNQKNRFDYYRREPVLREGEGAGWGSARDRGRMDHMDNTVAGRPMQPAEKPRDLHRDAGIRRHPSPARSREPPFVTTATSPDHDAVVVSPRHLSSGGGRYTMTTVPKSTVSAAPLSPKSPPRNFATDWGHPTTSPVKEEARRATKNAITEGRQRRRHHTSVSPSRQRPAPLVSMCPQCHHLADKVSDTGGRVCFDSSHLDSVIVLLGSYVCGGCFSGVKAEYVEAEADGEDRLVCPTCRKRCEVLLASYPEDIAEGGTEH